MDLERRQGYKRPGRGYVPSCGNPSNDPDLVGYWPLAGIVDRLYTPDLSARQACLRLGGLAGSRVPTAVRVYDPWPEYLDASHQALTIRASMPDQLPIPTFNPTAREQRAQRTIEVWFLCRDPFAASRQIVYQEGVKTEDRVWANQPATPMVDQLGTPINAARGETLRDGTTPKLVMDKHGVIMQVNRPIGKPTIKYSYYNL